MIYLVRIHLYYSLFFSVLVCIAGSKSIPHHLCLLVYHIPQDFKPFSVPHGNAKSTQPFIPTWPSTMKMIKGEIKQSGPREVRTCSSIRVCKSWWCSSSIHSRRTSSE